MTHSVTYGGGGRGGIVLAYVGVSRRDVYLGGVLGGWGRGTIPEKARQGVGEAKICVNDGHVAGQRGANGVSRMLTMGQ